EQAEPAEPVKRLRLTAGVDGRVGQIADRALRVAQVEACIARGEYTKQLSPRLVVLTAGERVNALRNLDAGDDRAETERQHNPFRFGDVNRSLVVVAACGLENREV